MHRIALMLMTVVSLASCSQILGVNDITLGDGGNTNHEGAHHGYVVSNVFVPTSQPQIREYGLDLGNSTSSKLDGVVDNAVGATLSFLASLNLPIQQTLTTNVDRGKIIQLIDFQSTDLLNANNAGFGIKFGQNPTPAACSSPTDTICRHHLTGSATFSIAADSPTNATFGGNVVNGVFTGSASDITLQLALGSTTLIDLKLANARASVNSISEVGIMAANIGGLVTKDELVTAVVPVIQVQFKAITDRDCFVSAGPPNCGCRTGSTGQTLIEIFDGDLANGTPRDCQFSTAEILAFALFDSCSKDSCTSPDSLSVGLRVEAVKAIFPM